MSRNTALIISYLFHPLFMPLLVMVVMLGYDLELAVLIPLKMKLLLVAILAVTTLVIPLLIILLMRRLGLISSLYMNIREERAFPLLVMAVFYYASYYLMKGIQLPGIYSMYLLGASGLIIILMVWNFFQKISLHTAGLGALTGILIGFIIHYGANFLPLVLAVILLSGILGVARLKLNTHQPSEIYLGWLAGVAVMLPVGLVF